MGGSTRQTHTGMRRPARQGILGLLAVLLLIGSLPGLGPAQAGAAEACTPGPGVYGLQVGETFQFNVTFFVPPEGYEIVEMVYTSVSYPSGDPVISVSPTGLITAIGPGFTRWEVQAATEPEWFVAPYTFEVCVQGGDFELPSAIPVPALEIGQTYQLEIDPGDFEIRPAVGAPMTFQAHSWEREQWAQEYWSGPVIDVNYGTGQVTAREPGTSTVTASIPYAAPGSTSTQKIELTFPVRVLTPLAGIGFNDIYGEVYVLPADDPDDGYSADLGVELRVGDIVETRINSGAILSLRDMTTFVMRANSRVRIGGQSPMESKLQLLVGHVWTNVK